MQLTLSAAAGTEYRRGDKWVNSGGKNAVVIELAGCGTRIERRRGHIKREGFLTLKYTQYDLATVESDKRTDKRKSRAHLNGRQRGGRFDCYTVYRVLPPGQDERYRCGRKPSQHIPTNPNPNPTLSVVEIAAIPTRPQQGRAGGPKRERRTYEDQPRSHSATEPPQPPAQPQAPAQAQTPAQGGASLS